MLLALLAACSMAPETPSPPAKATEKPVNPFKMKASTSTVEGGTRVELTVRTPGGDLPVQAAGLDGIVATLDGAPAVVTDASFEPGMHGCKVAFTVQGTGVLGLGGTLSLLNPDGTAWATLELENAAVD